MSATRYRRDRMVELLLTNGADVNGRGSRGETALHLAVETGNVKMTGLLLKRKADVNAKDIDGYTPILEACGNADVIRLLLANGANINDQTLGNTVLSRAIEMNSDVAVVQFLLTHGADITIGNLPQRMWRCNNTDVITLLAPYFKNSTNLNAQEILGGMLGAAMDHNQMDIVSTIMAVSISFQTNLLHKAVMSGIDADVNSFLVAHPDSVNDKEFLGWSPLHLASWSGQTAVAETLLSNHADPDSLDALHNTPLLCATFFGHSNLVEVLLRHHANMDIKGSGDNTPLDFAISRGLQPIADMLIKNGANLGSHTRLGDTPLHSAKEKGNVELINLLLAHGANINAIGRGNYKQTPLDIAVAGSSPEAVQLLIANGAGLQTRMQTHTGGIKTLFHLWAEGSGNTNVADQLLAAGCNLNATNGDGQTPLHVAVGKWHLTYKPDPARTNSIIRSLADFIVEDLGKEAAVWLLNHSAEVNARDDNGQTPLHLVMTHGNTNAIQCLLDYKADVNAKDNNGKTPLALFEDFKIQRRHTPMVDFKAAESLLLEHGAKKPVLSPKPQSGPQI
ncbi:MAG: ankyrin repeat domain-containing protein [Verrucomicrobiota bacterium]